MRNFAPQTREFNERAVTRVQGDIQGAPDFAAGVFKDLPGSSVPPNGLANSENYLVFGKYCRMRDGTQRWSNTTLPAIATGYSITKTGQVVTATVGTAFTPESVNDWIVHDDGGHERISAYICATQVVVDSSTTRAASTAAWTHGSLYGLYFHERRRKIVMHIGDRIYVSKDLWLTGWVRCWMRGTNAEPARSLSQMDQMDDYVVIFNANGPFKLDLSKTEPVFWKINSDCPSTLITNVAESTTNVYGYRRMYGMSVLAGTTVTRQRTDSGLVTEQMSGTCTPNEEKRDYGTVYQSRPVGEASTDYAVLVSGDLSATAEGYDTAAEWAAIHDGQYNIALNGTTRNIECDFSSITTMEEFADTLQDAMRVYVSDITVTYASATNQIRITSPSEGATLGYATAGSAGTDIGSTALALEAGTATAPTPDFTQQSTTGNYTYPTDGGAWTHYEIFRSLDIGVNGLDPVSGKANNKMLIIWNRSHPVAKAFVLEVTLAGAVTAYEGTFEPQDDGDLLTLADASTFTISAYTSASAVTVSSGLDKTRQAACLGQGDVAMAYQSGTTVTRTAGDTFAATDVGKILFWANGDWTVIKEYTDANNVEATLPQTGTSIAPTAVTWDPVQRTYTDLVRDDYSGTDTDILQLRPRASGLALKNRFYSPIPDCDTGLVAGVFIMGAIRGQQRLYYSQIPASETYYGGYYYDASQVVLFTDSIEIVREFPDDCVLLCRNSIHRVPINTFSYDEVEQIGEVLLIVSGQAQITKEIGIKLIGTIRRTGLGRDSFIGTDYGYYHLVYSGGQFQISENLAYNRYHKDFKQFVRRNCASSFDNANGHMIWGNNTEDTTSFTVYRDTPNRGTRLQDTDDDGTRLREVV